MTDQPALADFGRNPAGPSAVCSHMCWRHLIYRFPISTQRPHGRRNAAAVAALCASLALVGGCALRADSGVLAGEQSGRPALATAGLSVPSDRVEARDFEWRDDARGRSIPARLYLPRTEGRMPEAAPLVIFSHGLGGSRFGYSYLGRYWASQGLATLHIQHEGSDRSVWTAGGWNIVASLRAAASEENAIARAEDVSFAITRVLAEPTLAARLRADAIAVAGHSYGANTALLVGGATVERAGKKLTRYDPRVKALVLISAPPFAGEADMRPILAPIQVPTLHITGTEDVIRIPGYYSDLADRLAVFDAVGSSDKTLLVLQGASHGVFTDRISAATPDLNAAIKTATREASALFLRSVLLGEPRDTLSAWRAGVDHAGRGDLIERFVTPAAPATGTVTTQPSARASPAD
ncbi:MAG: alpha/beta hydrolase family protein [Casimicrobiaceae bacterium]